MLLMYPWSLDTCFGHRMADLWMIFCKEISRLLGSNHLVLCGKDNALKGPASTPYAQVFAPRHGWAIRKVVAAGMYALPTKAQLLKKLNEDEISTKVQMQSYVVASTLVIAYVDKLFHSKELGVDW